MDFAKININHRIVLPAADYYSELLKYPAPREPELWLIENGGGAVLIFPDKVYTWISPVNYNCLDTHAEETLDLTPTPKHSIIDSSTLLKAIAIAQNPALATQLIKD